MLEARKYLGRQVGVHPTSGKRIFVPFGHCDGEDFDIAIAHGIKDDQRVMLMMDNRCEAGELIAGNRYPGRLVGVHPESGKRIFAVGCKNCASCAICGIPTTLYAHLYDHEDFACGLGVVCDGLWDVEVPIHLMSVSPIDPTHCTWFGEFDIAGHHFTIYWDVFTSGPNYIAAWYLSRDPTAFPQDDCYYNSYRNWNALPNTALPTITCTIPFYSTGRVYINGSIGTNCYLNFEVYD